MNTKKTLALCLLLSTVCLLLIAARPRPCGKTRTECFNFFFPIATATPTQTPITTPVPSGVTPSACDMAYPNPYLLGACAHATLESRLATWTAANCAAGEWRDDELFCSATLVPPVTAPPAGYP